MIRLLQFNKWRIFTKVLPFCILFGGVKYFFHTQRWEPWQFDAFTASLFGTSTFVVAFVLNGTLSEYRSSEEIPALIVNSLEEIQDCNLLYASINKDYSPITVQNKLLSVAQTITSWIKGQQTMDRVYLVLDELNCSYQPLAEKAGAVWINRPQMKLANIRLWVERIKSTRDTDYLGPAYILLLIFLTASITALLLIRSESFSETLTVASFIFISFVYLLILIRDLDNPFQYDGKSCVDVDLSILENFCNRFPREK